MTVASANARVRLCACVRLTCAQGAAPVGPSYLVTKGGGEDGNLISELDGRPALAVLQELAQGEGDERIVRLLQRSLLVGISVVAAGGDKGGRGGTPADAAARGSAGAGPGLGDDDDEDFLIRQVMGIDRAGGLYIGERVEVGQTRLQFHVRDELAARDELALRLGRYRLEKTMSFGARNQAPLAAFQFSCNGRGRNMYSEADQDSRAVRDALGKALPTGGFFCNGEVGPLGVKGLGASQEAPTFVHGFTTCLALLYDTSTDQPQ